MEINDIRGKTKELSFGELEVNKVYGSNRLQRYVLVVDQYHNAEHLYTVCLESGTLYDASAHEGDVFTEVNARLEIY